MKIEIDIGGITLQGETYLNPEMVLCGGEWNPGVTVSGFSPFINDTIAYAINEGSVLFDRIESEESDDVEWKVIGASSKELVLLKLMNATPAPGLKILTEDGYCFTVAPDGSLRDFDQSFAKLSDIEADFVIGEKSSAPKKLSETLIDLGFKLIDTGGGVKAWHLEVGGYYILLTENDGSSTECMDEFCMLALFYYASSQDHNDHIQMVEGFWASHILPAVTAFRSGAWQNKQPGADAEIESKVAHAGELLIRAAAVLGTLTPEQLEGIRSQTDGGLPDSLAFALQAACKLSKQTRQSLKTHPPKGFEQYLK